jgi:folylpolyglutamate synthase/dihydropteroate synthase
MASGAHVIIGRQSYPGVSEVISKAALDLECQFTIVDPASRIESSNSCSVPGIEYPLHLHGDFQLDNSAIAISAIQSAFPEFSNTEIINGMDLVTRWPGRLEYVSMPGGSGNMLVDGAHNLDAARELSAYVNTCERKDGPVFWVYAATKGKDVQAILDVLVKPGDMLYFTRFGSVEEMPWVSAFDDWDGIKVEGVAGEMGGSLVDGLDLARKSGCRVVLCGSLYLVAELYRKW